MSTSNFGSWTRMWYGRNHLCKFMWNEEKNVYQGQHKCSQRKSARMWASKGLRVHSQVKFVHRIRLMFWWMTLSVQVSNRKRFGLWHWWSHILEPMYDGGSTVSSWKSCVLDCSHGTLLCWLGDPRVMSSRLQQRPSGWTDLRFWSKRLQLNMSDETDHVWARSCKHSMKHFLRLMKWTNFSLKTI